MSDKTYIHKLQRTSTHSYVVTLPKDIIDEFEWQEHQKVEIVQRDGKNEIVIRDWKE